MIKFPTSYFSYLDKHRSALIFLRKWHELGFEWTIQRKMTINEFF